MDLKENRKLVQAAMARGDYPTHRRHGHTCPKCSHRWWHDPDACRGDNATYETCEDAHVCSKCGTVQREVDMSICDKDPEHLPAKCELQDPPIGALPRLGTNPDDPIRVSSETDLWSELEKSLGQGNWSKIGSEEVVRGDRRLERVECALAGGTFGVTYFIRVDVNVKAVPRQGSDVKLSGAPAGFDPYTKIEIPVAGYKVKMTGDVLRRGGVPVPMNFEDSIAAANAIGAIPPTRALSAAALAFAKAAGTAIVMPTIQSPDPSHPGAHAVGTALGDQQATSFAAAYPAALPPDSTVVRYGGHKSMIIDPSGQINPKTGKSELRESGPGSMVLYGGLKADGSLTQHGIKSDHDKKWKDYSQPEQFFFLDAIGPNGEPVNLLAVIASGGPLGGPLPAWLVARLGGPQVAPGGGPAAAAPGSPGAGLWG